MEQIAPIGFELMRDIENRMMQYQEARERMIVREQELIQWRRDIELGLRDDIKKLDKHEAAFEQVRSIVESSATKWQDIQNMLASLYPNA